MSGLPSIVVLGSGRGSNFEAILAAVRSGSLRVDLRAVISDLRDAPILEKARAAGIPAVWVPVPNPGEANSPEERRRLHDHRVLEALRPHTPRFLVMAGYMRVVSSELLEAFRDERGYSRIVNVHPSLLPAFPGKDAYQQAWRHGVKLAGATVHLVELGVDEGPICAQEAFSIEDCTSAEEVERRGLLLEHRLYPQTLSWVMDEEFSIEVLPGGGRIRLHSNGKR